MHSHSRRSPASWTTRWQLLLRKLQILTSCDLMTPFRASPLHLTCQLRLPVLWLLFCAWLWAITNTHVCTHTQLGGFSVNPTWCSCSSSGPVQKLATTPGGETMREGLRLRSISWAGCVLFCDISVLGVSEQGRRQAKHSLKTWSWSPLISNKDTH